MTSQQAQLRIDAIWMDFELRGITEQWVIPCIKMKILKDTKQVRFQIESSRHPESPGKRKLISYDTWESAYSAYQNLIPQMSRVDNIRKGREKAKSSAKPERNPPITVQWFIEQVCDIRTLAADAHADAVEHKKPEAFFWSHIDQHIRSLMDACDEARSIIEGEDNEADGLTLPA